MAFRRIGTGLGFLLFAIPGWGEGPRAIAISGPGRADEAFAGCVGQAPFREAEAYAAVDPANRNNIVTAWQVRGPDGGAIQVSTSFDAGRTWSVPSTMALNVCAGGPRPRLRFASDSWATFGPEGRAYVTAIGFQPSETGPDLASGILVFASADGGRNWEAPTAAFSSDRPYRWHDNIAIAADPTRAGTVFAVTTRYEYPELADTEPGDEAPARKEGAPRLRSFGPAAFARTLDGGRTWSAAQVITPMVEGERVSAPQLAVSPADGRAFVVYYHSHKDGAALSFVASGDRGATWTEPSRIGDFVQVPDHHHPETGDFVQLAQDIVQVAFDPNTGSLYLAYADGRFEDGETLSVALTVSRDAGTSWAEPIRVSPEEVATAWLPGIAVDDSGAVGVAYLGADFSGKGPLAVSVRLRTYRTDDGELVAGADRELDRFEFVWPGDYLALVATANGFRVAYVGAGEGEGNPTEVLFR